jgi:hypothetical protein
MRLRRFNTQAGNDGGFGFMADLGVAYGGPHVSYTVSPSLLALAGASNVNAEEQNIGNTANR